MSPIALSGPHHVGIVVASLDRSLDWYRDLLGFTVTHQLDLPDHELRIAYISRDGFSIELFERANSNPPSELNVPLLESFGRQGHHHFAFSVADVDATFAELASRGIEIAVPPVSAEPLGVRYGFIRDPDGVWLEFLTPLEAS